MTVSEFAVEQTWNVNYAGPGRWILSHVLRYKLIIIGVFVGAFGNAALSAAVPVLTGQAFEAIIASSAGLASLRQAAILIAISQIVRGGLQLMRNYSSETLGQRLERDIRDELYASLIGKSMSFHDSYPSGELMARASNDVREINFMFNPGINLVIGSANFIIIPLIIAPQIHPQLIIIPIIYMLAYGFVVRNYLGQLQPAAEAVRSDFGKMNTSLAEAIEGIETVKGASQEKYEIQRFRQAVSRWRNSFVHQAKIEARFIPLLLLGLLQASGLFHSLELFRAGAVDVGDVVSFNGLLLMFGFPTWAAQFAYSRVASGIASSRRLLEVITARTDLDQNITGYTEKMRGAVTFENVTFCYESTGCESGNSPSTLSNINFQVHPGQTVAIVGQTGSGKSTIAKLINRIYDVNSGRVLVDGVDVRDWNMEALRRQISIIEQDIFLFSRSIADNIAFGYPGAEQQVIVSGAESAQAHEFITGFKEGYATVVGERGATLSGGQRQRLALARAFLTDPAILILDDATSAIDSATEDHIQRAIEKAAVNRTTFLITHRLSQIRWADLIIVMRKGRVAAIGTHDILMETSKEYRNIFARYE
ncbi:MAG: ABC transporter ATP-binding protein [Anaerolineae bacterium]|nr:ABC transporter ATP-binding protein [Anaerolineae bacterium]